MALNKFEKDVIDRLGRIETKLDNDYKALHGNGKPGLLDRVTTLETNASMSNANSGKIDGLNTRMAELELRLEATSLRLKTDKDWIARIRESIGWLVTTAIAIYAAFFR